MIQSWPNSTFRSAKPRARCELHSRSKSVDRTRMRTGPARTGSACRIKKALYGVPSNTKWVVRQFHRNRRNLRGTLARGMSWKYFPGQFWRNYLTSTTVKFCCKVTAKSREFQHIFEKDSLEYTLFWFRMPSSWAFWWAVEQVRSNNHGSDVPFVS